MQYEVNTYRTTKYTYLFEVVQMVLEDSEELAERKQSEDRHRGNQEKN